MDPPPDPSAGQAAQDCWQHGGDLLASLDGDDQLINANPAWTRVLGFEPGALAGRPFSGLLHPQDALRAGTSLTWAREKREQQFVARCRHQHGHHIDVAWSLTRGPGATLLASGRETFLPSAPAPAVGDVVSARLQRVLALGRLAGGIAHDFNNLLQALRNALEVLRRQPADAAGVQRLSESALRVLDHGARLTAQLLASSGAQRLQLSAVAVVPLLQGISDLLQRTLPPSMRLQLELDADAGSVMADPAQLESAVLNLVLNATDAMHGLPPGSPLVLRCERTLLAGDNELPTGEYLRLSVTDSGAGMTDAVRERAFEPFFTTRPLASGGYGRGLGLSQVHGFSRQCGGSTRIEASGSGGTTVSLLLPVLAAGQTTQPTAAEPVALVVADDDSSLRRSLCDSLRLLGYRAVPAADSAAVMAALQRHAADVMVIDMAMHGDASGDVVRRARLGWPGVGIVMVEGGNDGGEDPTASTRTAGDPVLHRPFDLASLSLAVGQAVSRT